MEALFGVEQSAKLLVVADWYLQQDDLLAQHNRPAIDEQHHFSACIHDNDVARVLAFERRGDVSSEYDKIVAV